MIKNLLVACFICVSIASFAQGFTATYGFQDVSASTGMVDPSLTPTATGLSFGPFLAVGTSTNPGASGRFSFTNWPLGGINGSDDYSSFTGVLSPTVYYQVTLTPEPGYTVSLNTMTFAVRRSGTGIRNYCVRSGQDNYINNLAASTGTSTKLSVIPGDIFFWNYDSVSTSNDQKGSLITFNSTFHAFTQPVTFRFYAWNAESAGGSFSIDNVSFNGTAKNESLETGIHTYNSTNKRVYIYPNPAIADRITVTHLKDAERLEIVASDGQLVLSKNMEREEDHTELELPDHRKGIYFLRLYSASGVVTEKIVFGD